jgi:hypothetical protein
MLARPRSHPNLIDPHASIGRLVEAFEEVFDRGIANRRGRLVDVHHHGPLEVRHCAGYCIQTLERLTPPQWPRLSSSVELMVDPERGLQCAIGDTGAVGADRLRWTVTMLGLNECRWPRFLVENTSGASSEMAHRVGRQDRHGLQRPRTK